ncbi:MAG: LURP-one-related family protein [Bacillota bacterium]|nr:LURP-one-related family protein [Bacillota bacterium]
MKLYIKQKVFSWADKFTVKDEFENDRYYCEGEIFSWGHKLHLFDMTEREVAFIKQKLLTWMPKFEVYMGDNLRVVVKKEFTFFSQKYTLEGTDWSVSGDFWAHNYIIENSVGAVATITKKWFSWGDSYELDIVDGADEILVLATVLAIDCVLEASQNAGAAGAGAGSGS